MIDEPVLDKPARVGAVVFGKGVKWSLVIQCAQRMHEFHEANVDPPSLRMITRPPFKFEDD